MRGFKTKALAIGALVAALLGLAAFPASAQLQPSLRAARAQDAAELMLAREVAYTNGVCGLAMTSGIDWPTVGDWSDSALVGACDRALGALELVCRAGPPQGQIASLARFVCAGDGSGPSLRTRILRYGAGAGADGFEQTRAFLGASQ